jgi:hypothetical protein
MDMWDADPDDKKLTTYCLPSYKFDIPVENFPQVSSPDTGQKVLLTLILTAMEFKEPHFGKLK